VNGDGTTSDQHVSGEAATARPLLFELARAHKLINQFWNDEEAYKDPMAVTYLL
jgi:hypothetical protein